MRPYARACVMRIHVHYKPWSSSTFVGSQVSAPRFLVDYARMKRNGEQREDGWKRRRGLGGEGGGFLWRPKWSLALAVITLAKEIKSVTKTGIFERREKTER